MFKFYLDVVSIETQGIVFTRSLQLSRWKVLCTILIARRLLELALNSVVPSRVSVSAIILSVQVVVSPKNALFQLLILRELYWREPILTVVL